MTMKSQPASDVVFELNPPEPLPRLGQRDRRVVRRGARSNLTMFITTNGTSVDPWARRTRPNSKRKGHAPRQGPPRLGTENPAFPHPGWSGSDAGKPVTRSGVLGHVLGDLFQRREHWRTALTPTPLGVARSGWGDVDADCAALRACDRRQRITPRRLTSGLDRSPQEGLRRQPSAE